MNNTFINKKNILKIVVFILLLIFVTIFLRERNFTNIDELKFLINKYSVISPIIYILLFAILPTFFITVTILAIISGAVFGFIKGAIYTFIGAFLNATLTYLVSKYVAYDFVSDIVKRKYSDTYAKIESNVKGKSGFILMLILRLLPLIPYTALNYMAGISGYEYKIFITSTLLGIIPGMLCYVNIGSSSVNGLTKEFVFAISLLIVFCIFISLIAKKYYKKNYE